MLEKIRITEKLADIDYQDFSIVQYLLFGLFILIAQPFLYWSFDQSLLDTAIYSVSALFSISLFLLSKTSVLRNQYRSTILISLFLIVAVSFLINKIAFEYLLTISLALGFLLSDGDYKSYKPYYLLSLITGGILFIRELLTYSVYELDFYSPVNVLILFYFFFDLSIRVVILLNWMQKSHENQISELSKYKAMFDDALLGVLSIDKQRLIIDANLSVSSMLGYEKDELRGMSLLNIVAPESIAEVSLIGQQLRSNQLLHYDHEIVLIRKDGSLVHCESAVAAIYEDGEFSHSLSTIKDITKRKRIELQLIQSREQQSQMFQNTDCGLAIIRKSIMVDCNPAFEMLIGKSRDKIVGKDIRAIIHPEDLGRLRKAIKLVHVGKIDEHTLECRLVLKKETKFARIHMIRQIIEDSGAQVFLTVNDITDLVHEKIKTQEKNSIISEQLDEISNQKVELEKYIESNLQLEKFAYIAAHDIKSPLRTIANFAQLLKLSEGENISEGSKAYIERIISSAGDLHRLTEDILQFSRVNTDKVCLNEIRTTDLLSQCIASLNNEIVSIGATISIGDMPEFIRADEIKISQVFLNLVRNALKFTPDEVVPRINIGFKDDIEYWIFRVEDNGIGIPEEFHDQIFGIFNKLHKTSEFEGSGLGLAIVKKIIEQHNGKIWLKSKVGEGTTFYFSIHKNLNFKITDQYKTRLEAELAN